LVPEFKKLNTEAIAPLADREIHRSFALLFLAVRSAT